MPRISAADDGPFYAGQNAHDRGHDPDDCPYPEGSEARERWLEGWRYAARDAALLSAGLLAPSMPVEDQWD